MADTGTYSTEQSALIMENTEKEVYSSLIKQRPLFDIMQRRQDSELGGGPFYRLPSTRELSVNKSGGRLFTIPIRIDALGVTTTLGDSLEMLDPQKKNQALRAEYNIKTTVTPLALVDEDINMAQTDEAVVDYVQEQYTAALEDHLNTLAGSSYLWSSTSASGWTGINHAIIDDPTTSALGGWDGTSHENWRNKYITTGAYRTSQEGIMELTTIMAEISGAGGVIGLHITNKTVFSYYSAENYGQVNIERVTNDPFAGYPMVAGAPVMIDPQLSSNRWYCIDLRAFDLKVLGYKRAGNKPAWALTLPKSLLDRQLAEAFAIVSQGNFCWRRRNTSGVQIVTG